MADLPTRGRCRLTAAMVLLVMVTVTCGGETTTLTSSEKACADNWPTISRSEMLRMKNDRSIDGIYSWSDGYWVSYGKIMDIC